MLPLGFTLYCVDVNSFYTYFVESFNHEFIWKLVKYFFCVYQKDYVDFSFFFLMYFITLIDFCMLKTSLHLRDKPHLIMVYDPFTVLLNSIC